MPDALFARIDNSVDVPVTTASVTWQQGAIGTFTFTFDVTEYPRDQLPFTPAALYRNGELVVSGIVYEPPELNLNDDRKLVYTVTAYEELGRLTCYRARAGSHYQNQPLTAILNNLLSTTPDWALGDVSSMIDPAAITTVDLRSKETLFAQISDAVRSIPQTFLRYGGFSAGFHRLDVGFFGEDTTYLIQHENLTYTRLNRNTDRIYRVVEAYGDRSSAARITLQDALANPATLAHPDYAQFPITQDPITGAYIVTNTALIRGCEITKQFAVHKTKNDQEPTPQERQEAGFALWQKAVRFLQSTIPYLSITARGFVSTIPQISDDAYLQAAVMESVYDPVKQCEESRLAFQYADWLRMTKITTSFVSATRRDAVFCEDTETRTEIEVELTNNSYAEDFDDDLYLYEELSRYDVADETVTNIGIIGIFYVSQTHNTVADPPDAACLPATAKEFVFPLPPPPLGATNVFGFIVAVSPVNASIQVTQNPALPGTPLTACVTVNGGWGAPAQDVEITVRYEFV